MAKNAFRIINRAIKQVKAVDVAVTRDYFGVEEKNGYYDCDEQESVDPIGALLLGKRARSSINCYYADAARILSKPKGWVRSLVFGWDGSEYKGDDSRAYAFGRRLRIKHIGE